jgi:hypothetical protein
MGSISVEWEGSSDTVEMAFIYIKDFFANNKKQYTWNWRKTNIINIMKHFENDEEQLNAFTKDASKIKI